MALISVISPVYNTEKLLPRCLDSILSQTFQDVELILVNDGSRDRSGEICEEYASKDSRIHVIHQNNSGVSAARNAALDWVMEHSNSRWIMFVDSDDWVHPLILQTLLELNRKYQVKVSACGYLETSDGSLSVSRNSSYRSFGMPGNFITGSRCWERSHGESYMPETAFKRSDILWALILMMNL